MKISLNWLKRYIHLEQTPEEIEEALTQIGFEVEGIEKRGLSPSENIVVGEVLSREPHPNADRLSVCQVQVGLEDDKREIVCGASNYKVGDRVPVALVGAVLPGDFKIKKTKLRGVPSEGMMCSARELGLGDDAAGLMILDQQPEIGTPIHTLFPTNDIIFDIEVTPNRPDCLSHIGIARELAAYFGLDCSYPEVTASAHPPENVHTHPLLKEVLIKKSSDCPHYTAYGIRGVKVGPSPDWLSTAIESVGLRSVNNIVDITNFVLIELGQPLHAFDAAKIRQQTLVVRPAVEGEKIKTLDEKERTLSNHMLVIADAERPLVVAGLMGSIDAEVEDATTDIVLEAAYFNPPSIRRTSRELTLSTDSSYRFERGVDLRGIEFAALRAIDLILQVAGGEPCGPIFKEGEILKIEREIEITPDFIRKYCGFGPDNQTIRTTFEALELDIQVNQDQEGNEAWKVAIPSFRGDLERPIDLVEEFLRIHGTANIPSAPVQVKGMHREDDPLYTYGTKVTESLVGQRFNQCVNYSLRTASEVKEWLDDANPETLALSNPLSSDQSHLRPSLLPGLLDTLKLNQDHKTRGDRFFEIGRVFRKHEEQLIELVSVGLIAMQVPEAPSWIKRKPLDFYTVKNIGIELLRLAGVNPTTIEFQPLPSTHIWQEGHAARAGNGIDGFDLRLGLLNLPMLKEWKISNLILAIDLVLLPEFLKREQPLPHFRPFSHFPSVSKDLALVMDESVLAGQVCHDLKTIANTVAKDAFKTELVKVFDVYTGKSLPEGKKSLALTLEFRAPNRTLKDNEVNHVFECIQQQISTQTPYQIRSEG